MLRVIFCGAHRNLAWNIFRDHNFRFSRLRVICDSAHSSFEARQQLSILKVACDFPPQHAPCAVRISCLASSLIHFEPSCMLQSALLSGQKIHSAPLCIYGRGAFPYKASRHDFQQAKEILRLWLSTVGHERQTSPLK